MVGKKWDTGAIQGLKDGFRAYGHFGHLPSMNMLSNASYIVDYA